VKIKEGMRVYFGTWELRPNWNVGPSEIEGSFTGKNTGIME
jgi:hypothetical protein